MGASARYRPNLETSRLVYKRQAPGLSLIPRISHLTPCVLARNLRQSLKNKELLPNHAKMTGEPNG